MNKKLSVFLYNKNIGTLSQDVSGKLEFQYNDNAGLPLSLSLPLSTDTFCNGTCSGFFNGLLPEGDNVRAAVAKKYGINPKNDFSLLKAIGYDCAGAVAFFEYTEMKEQILPDFFEINGEIFSDNNLEKYIQELPTKPLALGSEGMRLSLAGAQDKTAIVLIDNKIAIPCVNVPTTHILKPEIANLKETVENEFICMNSAKKLGIKIPNIEFRKVNQTKFFLIERYDRILKENCIKRLHQEDFCQVLNISSAYKYQVEGGVNFKQCFDILKKTSQPAVSIKQFIQIMIFNYLIGNTDAHGKNFSLLHYENGTIQLAPAYDLMCTAVYPDLSKRMAMKIGGYYEFEKIFPRHFEKLAEDVGISYTQLRKVIKNQCQILPDIFAETCNDFESSIGIQIFNIVNTNCKKVLSRF